MQIIQCLQLTVILAITPTMALALQTTLQVDPLTFQQEYPTLVVVQVAIIRVAIRATVAVDLVIQEEIRPITQETARIITLIHLVATMEVETTTMATMSEPIALAKEEVMALLRKEAFQVQKEVDFLVVLLHLQAASEVATLLLLILVATLLLPATSKTTT